MNKFLICISIFLFIIIIRKIINLNKSLDENEIEIKKKKQINSNNLQKKINNTLQTENLSSSILKYYFSI